ncbi:MAG TPA: hypothetical protein PLF26_17050 [Blastocatellia bacterium]|nr:hypothetical protein [Blastocatellia bacterium]
MTSTPSVRGRAAERGEGNLRLIVFLLLVALIGYLGIKNVPTYFAMQSLKQDLAEMTRGDGTANQPVEKIRRKADSIIAEYGQWGVKSQDVQIQKDGKLTTVTFQCTQPIDCIVTTYDWQISEVYKQQAY